MRQTHTLGFRFGLALAAALLLWLTACTSAAPQLLHLPPANVQPGEPLRDRVKYGTDHFALGGQARCAACHGANGRGIVGLGPDLASSAVLAGLSDAQLVTFVAHGCSADDPLNATGVETPPRVGNPLLTDRDLADLVAYLRTLRWRRTFL